MSIDSRQAEAFDQVLTAEPEPIVTLVAPGMPAGHESESGAFARHEGVPGHAQDALAKGDITLVGAGGLNSWTALGLVRSGAGSITLIDNDRVDLSNMARQLYFGEDLTRVKGSSLARNLMSHAPAECEIVGIPLTFQAAIETFTFPSDLLVVGVDNNDCRLACVRFARSRSIPAVFTMLSLDGMRCQAFQQGPREEDPCLWCALPNLDPDNKLPCAAAIISSCFLASSFTLFFAHRALMGWNELGEPFNWREGDLTGRSPSRTGRIEKNRDCPVCGGSARGGSL